MWSGWGAWRPAVTQPPADPLGAVVANTPHLVLRPYDRYAASLTIDSGTVPDARINALDAT